jgi:hypothetical protein
VSVFNRFKVQGYFSRSHAKHTVATLLFEVSSVILMRQLFVHKSIAQTSLRVPLRACPAQSAGARGAKAIVVDLREETP